MLKCIFYENGAEFLGLDLFTVDEILSIREEIESLFSDNKFHIAYYADYATFFVQHEDGEIPQGWLDGDVTLGPPKKERTFDLVGNRIPIRVPDHPTLQVMFVD